MELLRKAARTESDLACPHGVQFYDVAEGGKLSPRRRGPTRRPARHEPRRSLDRLLAGRCARVSRRRPHRRPLAKS